MMTFSRSLLVGAEFLDDTMIRFRGILEDHIYAMEVQMDVRISDGVIEAIQGRMKRFTHDICLKATDALQEAVGMSLREEGWVARVNREVGRKGCRHLAEITVECGRCLDPALLTRAVMQAVKADPSADMSEAARCWVESHPEVQGSCMARS
jgi:hypothetical protein